MLKKMAGSPSVAAYDKLLAGPLAQFLETSKKIGGDVQCQSELVHKCFAAQKQLISAAAAAKSKPSGAKLESLQTPVVEAVTAVVQFRESKRGSPLFNHLTAVSEGVSGLLWFSMPSEVVEYAESTRDGAVFYTNRVLKEYKEKSQDHVAWTKNVSAMWSGLVSYIKQYHKSGLSWGADASNGVAGAASGVPPPPPPPPADAVPFRPAPASDGANSLFAQLNRGSEVTAGLRHVTNDLKTHKNPQLRAEGSVVLVKSSTPASGNRPAAGEQKPKVGVKELQGKKWLVENFDGQTLSVDITEIKHTVYLCNLLNCTVTINGKCNSIMIDRCKKTGVIFGDLISALDIVNCQSMAVQSTGKVSTISIEKTDGCKVYLTKDPMETAVISSKSSELNLIVLKADGDATEFPIPEQLRTHYTGNGLRTEVLSVSD